MVPLLVPILMTETENILKKMRREPANARFADLTKVCEERFGKARQNGTSHKIFKTPWIGDPRMAEKHYSGEFRVRIPPEVHRALATQAAEQGVSLNRLASAKLAATSPM